MRDWPVMSATDAVALLDVLAVAGVGFWVNGGWGTDALVGHETRPHRDIDLFIERRHVRLLRDALGTAGLAEVPGGRAANFVLSDDKGREVDVHLFELDAAGNGLYPMSDGRVWLCQAEGLMGSGAILGKPVRCFTAALQLQCYSGYDLDADDLHDIAVIREAFPGAMALPELFPEA